MSISVRDESCNLGINEPKFESILVTERQPHAQQLSGITYLYTYLHIFLPFCSEIHRCPSLWHGYISYPIRSFCMAISRRVITETLLLVLTRRQCDSLLS